jgi:RNA 3'-terminal phosphate cyclase
MPGETDLHMSDQLLPYLALYGGSFSTCRVSSHARTMCQLLWQFGYEITMMTGGKNIPITICNSKSGRTDGAGTGMVTYSA